MTPLGWPGIVRLGLAQSALGAIVMLATVLLNRVMVVEYALPAALPAALVAWHYAVQVTRPRWGHGSDGGQRRTPWIVGGMGVLALGGLLATAAAVTMAGDRALGLALGVLGYTMMGAGVGAAGTSLLALLATRTTPARRPGAAALVWIMMIAGIAVSSKLASRFIDPYSVERLARVAACVAGGAFSLTLVAVIGIEGRAMPTSANAAPRPPFGEVMRGIWADPLARRFTVFVFVAMLAYSMQELILDPFAGLVFRMSVGQSTGLSGTQHGGVALGMILTGIGGGTIGPRLGLGPRDCIVGGCVGSALTLGGLAMAAAAGPGWPLVPTVFALGFMNGVFAVAAIGAMMAYAGGSGAKGTTGAEGSRVGLWGAAQAVAFGIGGFSGAAGLDLGRTLLPTSQAFTAVFAVEAALFLAAAALAFRLGHERAGLTDFYATPMEA